MGIPSSFFVGGQKISVEMVNHLDGSLGRCCVGAGWLRIADVFKEEHQSESSKENTFLHELVHVILDTMGRDDLSGDEVFVSSFAGFLCESLRTMSFPVRANEGSEGEL